MPDNNPAPSGSESRNTDHSERRRANRRPITPSKAASKNGEPENYDEEEIVKFRPEVIAITVMVIALLILAAIAI